MRAAILIAALVLSSVGRASSQESLRELGECVAGAREKETIVRGRIPEPVLKTDRKLMRMGDAIGFLEANLAYLKERIATGRGDRTDSLLVANAVEGCRQFAADFSWRAGRFQWMLLNLAALVVVLTLRLLFSIVPSHAIPAGPSDRPRSKSSRR